MSTPVYPAYPAHPGPQAARPVLDGLFGSFWPDRASARPRLLLGAVAVGLSAALTLPYRAPGIGTLLVFGAVVSVVVRADPRVRTPSRLGAAGLCLLLGSTVVLRDADWVVALSVLGALGLATAVLVDARTFTALAIAAVAAPLGTIRALPWLARSVVAGPPTSSLWATARTLALSALLAVVFGALFASADAVFRSWVDAVVPDVGIGTLGVRALVLVLVTAGTLTYAYLAINPPRDQPLSTRPVARPFEWLLPVGIVVTLFGTFVLAQLTVMFGGHRYVARTTGITYAEYVHQGFAQMCVATLLTLGVVAAAAAKAPKESAVDRLRLRISLGLLCALALVVVTSALYRIHVYEEAYGFTRLRLLVSVFEGWLGLLLVLVVAAGIRLEARWLPMAAVVSAALALLALSWVNPDAYIAGRNVARYDATGRIDTAYLAGLSADAAPALTHLPPTVAACVLRRVPDDDWLAWNLGRARARALATPAAACHEPWSP